jgi:hypothetical protein
VVSRATVERRARHLTVRACPEQLQALSFNDLQALCKQYGIPGGGNKNELVRRLLHSRQAIGRREEVRRVLHGTLKGFGWGSGQDASEISGMVPGGPFHYYGPRPPAPPAASGKLPDQSTADQAVVTEELAAAFAMTPDAILAQGAHVLAFPAPGAKGADHMGEAEGASAGAGGRGGGGPGDSEVSRGDVSRGSARKAQRRRTSDDSSEPLPADAMEEDEQGGGAGGGAASARGGRARGKPAPRDISLGVSDGESGSGRGDGGEEAGKEGSYRRAGGKAGEAGALLRVTSADVARSRAAAAAHAAAARAAAARAAAAGVANDDAAGRGDDSQAAGADDKDLDSYTKAVFEVAPCPQSPSGT